MVRLFAPFASAAEARAAAKTIRYTAFILTLSGLVNCDRGLHLYPAAAAAAAAAASALRFQSARHHI